MGTDIRDLRPEIDSWLGRVFSDAVFEHGGGQRLVYRLPSQNAALKVWIVSEPAQHERHVREVGALDRISSPHLPRIVAPIAQIELDGNPLAFYLEEWIEAPSIKAQMELLPMDPARLVRVARAVAGAIALLHAESIVHRDVSLGNVLAGDDTGYLIDLGLAKHLSLDSLTSAGQQLPMTQVTASPEQLQGASADLRQPTDIFSMGVVLAVAATGGHPYIAPGESLPIGSLIHRQLSHDVRGLPASALGDLIRDMLHPVMMFRPSAELVMERLQ